MKAPRGRGEGGVEGAREGWRVWGQKDSKERALKLLGIQGASLWFPSQSRKHEKWNLRPGRWEKGLCCEHQEIRPSHLQRQQVDNRLVKKSQNRNIRMNELHGPQSRTWGGNYWQTVDAPIKPSSPSWWLTLSGAQPTRRHQVGKKTKTSRDSAARARFLVWCYPVRRLMHLQWWIYERQPLSITGTLAKKLLCWKQQNKKKKKRREKHIWKIYFYLLQGCMIYAICLFEWDNYSRVGGTQVEQKRWGCVLFSAPLPTSHPASIFCNSCHVCSHAPVSSLFSICSNPVNLQTNKFKHEQVGNALLWGHAWLFLFKNWLLRFWCCIVDFNYFI